MIRKRRKTQKKGETRNDKRKDNEDDKGKEGKHKRKE